MDQKTYVQPATFHRKRTYYYLRSRNGSAPVYQPVTFLGYRPHPGELFIDDGKRTRVIHRRFLYRKHLALESVPGESFLNKIAAPRRLKAGSPR